MVKIVACKEVPNTKIDENLGNQIFDLIAAFANYGFNRSHAAAYGYIGFQTAYLKAHHPHEFYAASMNLELSDTEKLAAFARDMRRIKLAYKGPDVNLGDVRFSVEIDDDGAKAVRWALAGIKGVGEAAMHELVAERAKNGAFTGFHDFVRRTAGRGLNKKAYENLIRSGAMDCLHSNRAEMLFNLDTAVANASADEKSKSSGQSSFFDLMPPEPVRMSRCPEMPSLQRLQYEFDVLGIYLTGHPIEEAEGKLRHRKDRATILQAMNPDWKPRSKDTPIGAMVTDLRIRMTKKGDAMGVLTISDPTGIAEAVMFPREFAQHRHEIKQGASYVITCGIEFGKDDKGQPTLERKLIVRSIEPLLLTDLSSRNAA